MNTRQQTVEKMIDILRLEDARWAPPLIAHVFDSNIEKMLAFYLCVGTFKKHVLYRFLLQFDREQMHILSPHLTEDMYQEFSACLAINEARELETNTPQLNTKNTPKRL